MQDINKIIEEQRHEEEKKLNKMISDLWRIVGLTYITPQLAETITSVLQAKEELNRRRYIESLEEKVRKLQSNQKLKDIITKLK